MHKIGDDTTTADASGEFTEGNPSLGVPATDVRAPWMNSVQRELLYLLTQAGLTPNPLNDTQVHQAVTVFINTAVAALVASSPAALDTLNELAAALGNDPNFATTVTNAIAAVTPVEGVWTPSVGGTATYFGANAGTYIKIGNMVIVTGSLNINLIGTGSTWTISGLPFVNQASFMNGGTVHNHTSLATAVVGLGVVVQTSAATLQFYGKTAAATGMTGGLNLFGNNSAIQFSATYFV